jgi:hypothetical protein
MPTPPHGALTHTGGGPGRGPGSPALWCCDGEKPSIPRPPDAACRPAPCLSGLWRTAGVVPLPRAGQGRPAPHAVFPLFSKCVQSGQGVSDNLADGDVGQLDAGAVIADGRTPEAYSRSVIAPGVQWLLTSESASRTLMNACLVTPSRRAS